MGARCACRVRERCATRLPKALKANRLIGLLKRGRGVVYFEGLIRTTDKDVDLVNTVVMDVVKSLFGHVARYGLDLSRCIWDNPLVPSKSTPPQKQKK